MKAVSTWNFNPYTPLDRPERAQNPYVTRLAPGAFGFLCEFTDNGQPTATHTLFYRLRESDGSWDTVSPGDAKTAVVEGLLPDRDYAFYVARDTDNCVSETRLLHTGKVPGTIVNYLHPDDGAYAFSGQYLCSPSLVRLPSGRLLASMDVFKSERPQNLTLLYYSDDDGDTWHWLTELFPCFWGHLFHRNGRLYMLAVSQEYGDLLIGASDDEGKTWSVPTVLFRGACHSRERGLHRAPMRFCESHGRIWTDVEYGAWGSQEMNNAVLSAPADCLDYTDPAVWTMTDFWCHLLFEKTAEPGQYVAGCIGGIEGNLVEGRDGTLYDFLRYDHKKCLMLRVDHEHPEISPVFERMVDMEITASKFDLQWDGQSGLYWALCSRALANPVTKRNLLSLFKSKDLIHWECVADILDERYADRQLIAFQYVSFLIEGDDILFLSRTAYNHPEGYHDNNYQTFHRIKNFRNLG